MKQFTGKVVSKATPLTAVVKVDSLTEHPVYKKRVKHSKKYLVHDLKNVKVGDTVVFQETRPFSRHKKWQIIQIVNKK